MTKQPELVLTLKRLFREAFDVRLSVRACAGSMKGAYLVSLPRRKDGEEHTRLDLIRYGAWLERQGFAEFYGHSLSAADGWTRWNGGLSVYVRLAGVSRR